MMRESTLRAWQSASAKYIHVRAHTFSISGFDSASSASSRHVATVTFRMGAYVYTHDFIVLPNASFAHDALLGQDFWHTHLKSVDVEHRALHCRPDWQIPFYVHGSDPVASYVRVCGNYTIPAHSAAFVTRRPRKYACSVSVAMFAPYDRFESRTDHALAHPSPSEFGVFHILFRNSSSEDISLRDGINLGAIAELRESTSLLTLPEYVHACEQAQANTAALSSPSPATSAPADFIRDAPTAPPSSSPPQLPWKFTVPEGLTPAQTQQIHDLVSRNASVFVKDEEDYGVTNVLEQTIELSDTHPIYVKQYPLDHTKQQAMDEIVERMLASNKLEETESPYNTPVLIVPKPKGGWRLVNDFRKLNAVTKRQRWPLPNITELIESVRGSKWFSSLDMRDAFWQIPIAPEHRQYTAFTTPTRRVQCRVMPMGLINSSHCFARLMSIVMRGLPWVLCYIDDIAIHAPTFELLLERTEIVFKRLLAAGLKLNGGKTHVGPKEAEILGFLVDEHGYRMHPAR